MARLNPKRRLIAKLKAWDQHAHELTKAYNAEAINSTAPVKSCLGKFNTSHVLRAPRELPDMGARKGKVQDGKFKPDRGTFKRFGQK